MRPRKATVAIVQASPVYMNLEQSTEKALDLVTQAAAQGAQIIVFGETWLPGYPAWLDYCPDAALWNHEPTKQVFARLRENSILVPGRETTLFGRLAQELAITLVMGVNERVDSGPGNGTLYNSLLFIGPLGKILNHHRKLMPTYTERMVWGQGDGHGMTSIESAAGRLSGLICWEHWMPLSRHVLHEAGEDIHVAAWPSVHEMHQLASRHYAFEGRCFVLAAGLIMTAGDLPIELNKPGELANNPQQLLLRGGSAIIGPDGHYVVEPVFDRETILIRELDLQMIDRERMTLDVSGHYHRPDIFDVRVRRSRSPKKRNQTISPVAKRV
ncbi:carbon-nitrogen hydrolase family protein [bacterium]|nr:carbon-nitrogen hydrolase family protein [bacterium]MCI0605975.1 carbon-nitrogen hydrolase family protein [bacterium]